MARSTVLAPNLHVFTNPEVPKPSLFFWVFTDTSLQRHDELNWLLAAELSIQFHSFPFPDRNGGGLEAPSL